MPPRPFASKKSRNRGGPPATVSDIPGLAARMAAARLLAAVVDARTPLDGLTDAENGHPQYRALDSRDRALVRAVLATALRWRRLIEDALSARLDTPLPANARTLAHILHVGAAQIPDSAAVDLAVGHARADPRTVRFAGLVNALLRRLSREKDAILSAQPASPGAPDWFASRLRESYGPERAAAILAIHAVEAPTDFTVKADPASWAETFGGIVLPTGSVRVVRPAAAVPELSGYDSGDWWVQDAAAALPARLFGPLKGFRVADLCAAPGGKTAQLALAGADVTAIDISASRLGRLRGNLARLGLEVATVQADLAGWQPDTPFDAVLLDAPCSSTGTVRRHPDVPWTKTPEDIDKLAAVQRRLLERAADVVRPGGRLVFSNCSLDPKEGEEVVRSVLASGTPLAADPVQRGEFPDLDAFLTPEGYLRTTPADLDLGDARLSGLDGFFAARFRRV